MTAESTQPAEHLESNLIITDGQAVALALQQALARLGEDGPEDKVIAFDDAAQAIKTYSRVTRRVLVALGEDTSRGLAIIRMIREITSVPLYVVGPRDAGLILDAVHSGADSFIEDFDPLDEYLARALARPMSNGKASAEGKLICVSSVRGGCGGSVISANLAMAFAQRLKRAALCDFDFQNGVCDALLNLKPKHTILDLMGCAAGLDRNSIDSALTRHAAGVHLLSASLRPVDGAFSLGDLCQRVVRTMRQMFPVVVIDLPLFNSVFDTEPLMSASSKVVLVTQMDFNSIRSARRALEHLARTGVSSERIQIVGNRDGQPNSLAASHAEEALNRKFAHIIPDDSKTVNRSVNCGSPFFLNSVGTPLIKKLDSLAELLLGEYGHTPISPRPKIQLPATRLSGFAESLQQWKNWLWSRTTETEATV